MHYITIAIVLIVLSVLFFMFTTEEKITCDIEYIDEEINDCRAINVKTRNEFITVDKCWETKGKESLKIEITTNKIKWLCDSVIANNSQLHQELTQKIADVEKQVSDWKAQRTSAEEDNKKYREVLSSLGFQKTSPSQETGHMQDMYMQN